MALFLRACRLGIASGCTNTAAYIVRVEQPAAPRLTCAVRTFELTCNRGDPWGCTMLGELLAEGHGVPRDLQRALRVLPRGCVLGEDDPACLRARQLQVLILAARQRGN